MSNFLPIFDKNASYIWACYIAGVLLLLFLAVFVWGKAQSAKKKLKQAEQMSSVSTEAENSDE